MSLLLKNKHQMPVAGVILSACLLSGQVSVSHADEFSQRVYLNGGIGLTRVEPESSNNALQISENSDAGVHLGIGYDINRFLSLEGYAATLGTAEVEFLGTDVGSVDYMVFGLSAIGYLINSHSGLVVGDEDQTGLFRREGLSLYARVGVGHMRNDAERVGYRRAHPNHFAFGLGLEYGLENGFAIRTELMSLDTDAKYLNIGVVKRFGDVDQQTPIIAAATPMDDPVDDPVLEPPPGPVAPALPEQLKVFKPIVSPPVYFDFDLSKLTPEFTQKLDAFAEEVIDTELQLRVEGHTDWIATEAYNMSLSVRRAEAVANYLVSKGIARDRLSTIGYGETRPVSNNDTDEGRALNRRSEIVLY